MMAQATGPTRTLWQKHRLQAAAVLAVVLLAWLYNYLEQLPVARGAGASDLFSVGKGHFDEVRLQGIDGTGPITIRTVAARQMTLTLPTDARMTWPGMQDFRAKAAIDAATLHPANYDGNAFVLTAAPRPQENVTVDLKFADGTGGNDLLLQRLNDPRRPNAWRLVSEKAKVSLDVNFFRPPSASGPPNMYLSLHKDTALLGEARFELDAGKALIIDFQPAPDAAGLPPVRVDLPGDRPRLMLSSVTSMAQGQADPGHDRRIACAAGGRTYLWAKLFPRVGPEDCGAGRIAVESIDLDTGQIALSGRAFFAGFGDTDSAHLVKWATGNIVINSLLGAVLGGVVIQWAIAQFRKRNATEEEPTAKPRRRRKGG